MRKMVHKTDTLITKSIQGWPEQLRLLMLFFTLLGQPLFTVSIPALLAVYGFYRIITLGDSSESLIMASSIAIITFGVCTLLKAFLKRERPDTEYVDNMYFDTFSFPSGHAAGAVATYGLVAYLALSLLAEPWSIIVAITLGVLSFFIGLSRVFLGAHYPSDVIGGWLLGAGGLYIIIHYFQPTL